jgi:uncharacterized protein with FMN-binding domain
MKQRLSLSIFGCVLLALMLASCASPMEIKASISQPDMKALADGVYDGKAFIFPVDVEVRTKVAGGRIESIELVKHFNGRGQAAETIIPIIIERQSVDVDVIAGATQSSVTILKAVEDSLKKGRH